MTMEDYLHYDEESFKTPNHGDIVDGIVVRVDPDEVLVDIGAKAEGVSRARSSACAETWTPSSSLATRSRSTCSSPRTKRATSSSAYAGFAPRRPGSWP